MSADDTDPSADQWPAVSVVMPIRNEGGHLRTAVDAVLEQDYPRPFEVVLAVASSSDDTEAIASELAEQAAIVVVTNPAGSTSAGLNRAIRASAGEVIVRVDGHALLPPGYIRRSVETLRRTAAVNVGGVQRAVGTTPFERAVADAMSSKFGTGDASFHYGGAAGPTDTVYLGVFDRAAIEAVGLFDERLVRNQDYELNIRLRAAGGVVWFDPDLEVTYRPRDSLRALARQYFDYGRWKRLVLRTHPGSLRWRQVVPPLATAAIGGATLVGLARPRALMVPATYAVAVAAAAWTTAPTADRRLRLMAIFPTMHLSWGVGFLVGTPAGARQPVTP